MTTITGISAQPKQQLSFVLDDGSQVSAYLEYRPQQLGWFANLAWGDWSVNGLRLVSSPNLLRQFRNVIPFGLALLTSNNADPLNVTDFSTATSVLVLLNAADVELVEASAYPGN